jgi:type I restriction enzyme S subunit
MQKVELKNYVDILSGFAFNSQLFNDVNDGMPLIRIRDVGKNFSKTFYPGSYDEKFLVKKGDYLIGMDGDFRLSEWMGENALLNQRVCKISIAKPKELNNKYLLHFLPKELKLIEDSTSYATVKHLSVDKIKKIQIPLPTLPTQQKIAEILDTADQLRQYNKQLIEKYDALTQSLFLDMFGDIIINSKEWEKKTLKEISIRFSDGPFGSNLKTEHYSENGIQVIRLQNIGINKFNNNGNDKSFVDETHYNNVLKKYSCYPNDIVIATMGNPNIRACVIPNNITVAVNKADCVLLRVNSNIANQIYIVNLLNLEAFLNLAVSFIHGQTRSRISSGQLAKIEIPIPPIELQNQFAERVQMIETQKQQAQEALAKSEDLFQSLLQRAFKGELV